MATPRTTYDTFTNESPRHSPVTSVTLLRLFLCLVGVFAVCTYVLFQDTSSTVIVGVPEVQMYRFHVRQEDYRTPGLVQKKLAVEQHFHSFMVNDTTRVSAAFRSFNKQVPGEVIKVMHGDTLEIALVNNLGPETIESKTSPNTFRQPNTTSLHIHGIHASPVTEDNVFRVCKPGQSRSYSYRIRKDHPAGTFFIHPHFHGSSTIQVGYAMASPLVVLDDKAMIKQSIIAEVDADIVLLIGNYDQGSGNGRDIISNSVKSKSSLELFEDDSMSKQQLHFVTVNGVWNPVVTVKQNAWNRLRLVNAVIDGVANLLIQAEHDCQVMEVAADGIYFQDRRPRAITLSSQNSTLIVPGSRKDLLVRCGKTSGAKLVQVNTGKSISSSFLGGGTNVLSGPLFRLSVIQDRGRGSQSQHERHLVLPTSSRSKYAFQDLMQVKAADKFILRYNFPGPSTPKDKRDGDLYQFYGINGELYTGRSVVAVKLNTVQEWLIVNDVAMDGTVATESHPFHMHTNHFQVINVTGKGGLQISDYRLGDWRDTISIPPGTNVTIRFKPLDFTGKSLAHCHVFTHSDTGMMIAFDIVS